MNVWFARIVLFCIGSMTRSALADPPQNRLTAKDVFQIEYASDPQISPDGSQIVYVRNSADIMTDKFRPRLWIMNLDGSGQRPLTSWEQNATKPKWSPDGKRLAFLGKSEVGTEVFVRYMDNGETARLTNLTESPGELSWSPDGNWLAFSMRVPEKKKPFVELPEKPEGAKWADPPKVIDRMVYRFDGNGYLKEGFSHLFVLPADGGTPRQLTFGRFHHSDTPIWTRDGKSLIFSANREPDWEHHPLNSDLYELDIATRKLKPLTTRTGPDSSPAISPDGKRIAFVGFNDNRRSYHQTDLYILNREGKIPKCLTAKFDRAVSSPTFSGDGKTLYFQFDSEGVTKIGSMALSVESLDPLEPNIEVQVQAEHLGGETLGRPYANGSFTVSKNDVIAHTLTSTTRPANVAVRKKNSPKPVQLTQLNQDLLEHKELGKVEAFSCKSSHDGRAIGGWIVKPPGFDPQKKYPLILEIHGGPFANYGERFAVEMQLYASAGYVVLYLNPRGSTSYGLEFARLIDMNYPSQDYDDLMSGVDALIAKGYVNEKKLYVTGGSGGGVLSSWIVGKTNRFQAAVVAKPVINWHSFVLTADAANYFAQYWFEKFPWEDPQSYQKRSPLSLVGNVKTPTMLLTGEVDYRTPISESEQFYQALKLRKIEAMLVRVPGASHGIASRPSHLIAKVAYILKWFEMH